MKKRIKSKDIIQLLVLFAIALIIAIPNFTKAEKTDPNLNAKLSKFLTDMQMKKIREAHTNEKLGADLTTTDGKFEYHIDEETNTITICKYNGSDVAVTIPDKIDEKNVTRIEYDTFWGNKELKQVTIPNTITEIDEGLFFNCESITSISVNSGNKNYASVNGVLFNKDKTELICYPHAKSGTSYEVPSTVKVIKERAFYNCENLATITLPNLLTTIECDAFTECYNLKNILIPASVTLIDGNVFMYCTSLSSINVNNSNKNYASVNGVLFDKDKTTLICYPALKSDNTFEIPNTVTEVGDYSFYGCKNLTSVTITKNVTRIGALAFTGCMNLSKLSIPNNVEEIGMAAFSSCTNLTTISIGSGVTTIEDFAFGGNMSLKSINVNDDNKNYASADGVLFNKDKTELIAYPAKKDGNKYSLPTTVKIISDSAFDSATNLTNIILPSKLTTIGTGVFNECENLTQINIPANTTDIGIAVFTGCSSLTSINIDSTNKNYASVDGVLFNKEKTSLICYPANKSGTNYAVPSGVEEIEYDAFSSSNNLTSITISKGTKTIKSGAFSCISNLKSITIPDTVTEIGEGTFMETKNVTIYCYKNSEAEKYAKNNNIKYSILTETGVIKGDLNKDGKLTSTDILQLKKRIVGLTKATDEEITILDMNGDGKLTATDLLLLKKKVVGLI